MADIPRGNRPLSPHLSVYRLPMAAITSILTRATGQIMLAGLLLIVWWLVAAATGPRAFATAALAHPAPGRPDGVRGDELGVAVEGPRAVQAQVHVDDRTAGVAMPQVFAPGVGAFEDAAVEALRLAPHEIMMVAAHSSDLAAAAGRFIRAPSGDAMAWAGSRSTCMSNRWRTSTPSGIASAASGRRVGAVT